MKRLLCFIGLHDWHRMDERVSPHCLHKRLVCQRCFDYRYLSANAEARQMFDVLLIAATCGAVVVALAVAAAKLLP